MPPVSPKDAKKAIRTVFDFFLGACDALEAMEEGDHPVQAVTKAVKKAKKRKKAEREGKLARKRAKKRPVEVIDVQGDPA